MAFLSESIGKAIAKNDLDLVITRDLKEPFREETRKGKRNLVTASFAAILIAALDIQVNSFAGLSSSSGAMAADTTRGLACLAVIYFLIGYLTDALLDYTAWRIEIKRLKIAPYLSLVRAVERTFHASHDQLKNVAWTFNHLKSFDQTERANPINMKNEEDALNQLPAIEKHQREALSEMRPLLASWDKTLKSLAFELSGRRVARAMRMWAWDLILPVTVAVLAVARTFDGLSVAIPKLLGYPT